MLHTERLLKLLFVFLLAWGIGGCSTENQTAAVVNGEKVTRGQLKEELEKRYWTDILSKLTNQKMILIEARKQGIKVKPKDVEDRYLLLNAFNPLMNGQMKAKNVSVEDLKKELFVPLALERLALKESQEEDIRRFFSQIKERVGMVKLRYILVKSQKEADDILKELKAGTDFAALEKTSLDQPPRTAGPDGKILFLSREYISTKLSPEVAQEVFSLKPGKAGKVINNVRGYHILLVEEKRDTYEQLRDVAGMLYAPNIINEYLMKLKKNSTIKAYDRTLTRELKVI